MTRALIFDCDGVLADTERHGHLVAFNALFSEEGFDLQWSTEEYAELLKIGGGKERMLSVFSNPDFVARYGLPTDREDQVDLVARWHKRKTNIFRELVEEGKLPARPGVARLAQEAHDAGWKLAVASTSAEPSVRAIVAHVFPTELAERFSVFAGDIVDAKKLAPDIYLLALDELELTGSDVCVVEDSAIGATAAIRAGCPTIVTVSDFTAGEDFGAATLVVDSLGDEDHPTGVIESRLDRRIGDRVKLETIEAVIRAGVPDPTS